MACYGDDEMLGKFMPGLKKALAAIDPTSSKVGGKVTRALIGAAGTFVGIPPTTTTGALSLTGSVTGGIKQAKKEARKAKQQETAAYTSTVGVPSGQSSNVKGEKPVSTYMPLIFAAGAGVIVLAALMFMKK